VVLSDVNVSGQRDALALSARFGEGRAVDGRRRDSAESVASAVHRSSAYAVSTCLSPTRESSCSQRKDAGGGDFDSPPVNYKGYFLCVKNAAPCWLHSTRCPDYWSDIIQINSKSGLRVKQELRLRSSKLAYGLTSRLHWSSLPTHQGELDLPWQLLRRAAMVGPGQGLFAQYLRTARCQCHHIAMSSVSMK